MRDMMWGEPDLSGTAVDLENYTEFDIKITSDEVDVQLTCSCSYKGVQTSRGLVHHTRSPVLQIVIQTKFRLSYAYSTERPLRALYISWV